MRAQSKIAIGTLVVAIGLMFALLQNRLFAPGPLPEQVSLPTELQPSSAGWATNTAAAAQRGKIQAERGENRSIDSSRNSEEKLETLLDTVTQLRAEPFDLQTLDELDRNLSKFPSPRERLQAAALLNRYGRSSGAEHLRSVLRENPNSADGTLAALALTMSQDKEALPLIEANFGAYASNPEFAEAVARWPEPMLADRARSLLSEPSLGPSLAKILVRIGDTRTDPSVLATSLSAAMANSGNGPARNAYEAALVKIGKAPVEAFLQRLKQLVDNPMRIEGLVKEPLALVGPEHARPVIEQIFDRYIVRRELNTMLYRKHLDWVRSGEGERHPLPQYPAAEEQLLREAVSVAVEWNLRSLIQPIYQSLQAAQEAVYQPLLNRELMAALVVLDPEHSRATLLAMGFPEADIEAGSALSKLPSLPVVLRPRQMEIALSRRVDPDPVR